MVLSWWQARLNKDLFRLHLVANSTFRYTDLARDKSHSKEKRATISLRKIQMKQKTLFLHLLATYAFLTHSLIMHAGNCMGSDLALLEVHESAQTRQVPVKKMAKIKKRKSREKALREQAASDHRAAQAQLWAAMTPGQRVAYQHYSWQSSVVAGLPAKFEQET